MEPIAQQFGVILRRRRLQAGLSQEQLAIKAGLHRTTMSLLERGMRVPSILVVQQLANGMGTTMTSLIQDLDKEIASPSEDG